MASPGRLLVLGGTSFVGRAIVAAALASGREVTLFNRGRTQPDLFADADRRVGDRDSGDYRSLAAGEWDSVVDVNAYVPRHVAEASTAVDGRAARYVFISTGSVYDLEHGGDAEEAPRVAAITDSEELTNETYGGLKVACEDLALDRWGDALTIVRPGIVAGPHDPSDRFTWWVRRAARAGQVVFPGRPAQPVQVIDARDLAAFVLRLVGDGTPGAFNSVGPDRPTTLAEVLDTCAAAAETAVDRVEVSAAWFERQEAPWPPLVVPPAYDVLFSRRSERARSAGLSPRSLVDTARDTLAWDRARGEPDMPGTLDAAAESALLDAWHGPGGPGDHPIESGGK